MSEVKIEPKDEVLLYATVEGIRKYPYPEEHPNEYRLEINGQIVEVSESDIFGKVNHREPFPICTDFVKELEE